MIMVDQMMPIHRHSILDSPLSATTVIPTRVSTGTSTIMPDQEFTTVWSAMMVEYRTRFLRPISIALPQIHAQMIPDQGIMVLSLLLNAMLVIPMRVEAGTLAIEEQKALMYAVTPVMVVAV